MRCHLPSLSAFLSARGNHPFGTGARAIRGALLGLLMITMLGDATGLSLARADSDRPTYLLRYKFEEGEALRTQVVHLATTETTIQGNTQVSRSRSVSTKQWKILKVQPDGNFIFEHSVLDVDMWQSISGQAELRYNSRSDEDPPKQYEHIAKTVGVPLTVVTINPRGEELERDDQLKLMNLSLGEITTPLPADPVAIGHSWHSPGEVRVRSSNGQARRVKTRQKYELLKVKTGVATIRVKTQVLTPVNDPAIQAQLVQQLNNGTIKFDIDAGRVIGIQMDWNEEVVQFSGAESHLKYLARFTEEVVTEEQTEEAEEARVARRPSEPSGDKPSESPSQKEAEPPLPR